MDSVPQQAPIAQTPYTVHLAAQSVTVPLATVGRLAPISQEIYRLLGIDIAIILVQDREFTVLAAHLVAARDAIRASLRSETRLESGRPVGLPAFTRNVAITAPLIPHFQSRLSPLTARLYELFDIDTVDVVVDGTAGTAGTTATVYTVLVSQFASARGALASGQARYPAGETAVPITGLRLQDYYVTKPDEVIRAAALLFGASFLCIDTQNEKDHQHYWVLANHSSTPATLARLGLTA